MAATWKITTFHDSYGWCVFINGDYFGRFKDRLEGWGAAALAIERLRRD